jgi:hypothetical protein
MLARLPRVRWFGFLSLVMLTLLAFGCDQLGGSKSKKTSDKSSHSDDDDDDDDAKSKKKKKKKKADDDEDEDKPAPSETAAAPVVPPPAPTPAPQAGGEFPNAPTCDKYMRVMTCLIAKMPADSRASMEQSVSQMRDAFKQLGSQAESTCQQALSSTLQSAAQLGCGGDAPSVPSEPSQPSQPSAGGSSPVPTTEEWNGVTREVTVRGSGKLNCETKMLREWLRVSCKGKNFTGGTPTNVAVTSGGGRGEDFAFSSGGVTSVVVRFAEGINLEATFTWTDRTHVLKVFWPRGAPEPPAKGVFIGVD